MKCFTEGSLMGNFTTLTSYRVRPCLALSHCLLPALTARRLRGQISRAGKDLFRFQNIFMAQLNHNKVSYFINMQWPR